MSTTTLEQLADDVGGRVVQSKKAGYGRIVVGDRTICYANPRKDGAQLDFRAKDVEDAPAQARKGLDVKGTRARLRLNGKNGSAAKELVEHVAGKAGAS